MSRSRKKRKIRGITSANSEKQSKRKANRRLRRIVNQKVKEGEVDLPGLREVSDIWEFDKDGKTYNPEMSDKDLRK